MNVERVKFAGWPGYARMQTKGSPYATLAYLLCAGPAPFGWFLTIPQTWALASPALSCFSRYNLPTDRAAYNT